MRGYVKTEPNILPEKSNLNYILLNFIIPMLLSELYWGGILDSRIYVNLLLLMIYLICT